MSNYEESSNKKKGKKYGAAGGVTLAVIIGFGLIIAWLSTTRIDPGYAGVIYSVNGGIQGETLDQGWHLKYPTWKVTEYTIGIEQSYLTADDQGDSKKDDSFKTPSSDGKTVTVSLEFSYMFDRDRLPETFTRFKAQDGKAIKDTFIKPKVKAWTQEVTAKYPVADIFGDKRTDLNNELDTYLKAKFDPYGIIIDTVNFTDISVDDETKAAIQKKVNAQQELELAKIQKETANINANKDKEVALVEAEKDKEVALIQANKKKDVAEITAQEAKIKAQGEADALAIEAEAEAKANERIAASLTPELLEKLKYEAWNGELPQVQTGSNGSTIVDVR